MTKSERQKTYRLKWESKNKEKVEEYKIKYKDENRKKNRERYFINKIKKSLALYQIPIKRKTGVNPCMTTIKTCYTGCYNKFCCKVYINGG